MKVKLSIVIVDFNGNTYTEKCLESILKSKATSFEIIVVDNGSTDNGQYLKSKYLSVKDFVHVISLDKNYGPAFARNIGVANSLGDYLCFLDNDTEVDQFWFRSPIEMFTKDKKIGIIQSKLLLNKERNKIDYVGEYLGQNGFLVQPVKGGAIDTNQFSKSFEILAAKSAGMFIRKTTFEKIGGFDQDYFIYVEETDLGWRSWLAGYKAVFCPESVVFHEFGTSTIVLGKSKNSFNAKFHGSKNYIQTLSKNLEFKNIFHILIPHIVLWQGLSIYNLLRGQFKSFLWINEGIFWNISHIPKTIKKRCEIQKSRKISDDRLFSKIMRKQNMTYFLNKAIIKHKIGNADSF